MNAYPALLAAVSSDPLIAEGITPRAPETVMRLSRMGSFHASRLSFMRVLLRRITAEGWRVSKPVWTINAQGVGRAVYSAQGPERAYSLVAFAHDLPPEQRSDRVIATAWDATFTLFDGIPSAADLDRLEANVPLQEAGRISERELCLARANRSVRLWDHVVDRLAAGAQPDLQTVLDVGYLMRTTAVYGSSKFGAADRDVIAARPECAAPFQVEMLTVWLIRTFVMDLVEHMARAKGGATAVPIEPALRRRFGIGNSTGLGMAPFLMTHPVLLNNWIAAREWALARVRSVSTPSAPEIDRFNALVPRVARNAAEWQSSHPVQMVKLAALREDLSRLTAKVAEGLAPHAPWNTLWVWAETALSEEGQEALASLLIEVHPDLVDGLAECMAADEAASFPLDGAQSVAALRQKIVTHYGWALSLDWSAKPAQARVWYVSQEKLEPRLGERWQEDVAEWEQPLQPGRDVAMLERALVGVEGTVAAFVLRYPEHRYAIRRVQICSRFPYAEIHDNTISDQLLPIDLLRAKLSFFGATHFDPRSDRWVRINMFRGAPFPHEIAAEESDLWAYPV